MISQKSYVPSSDLRHLVKCFWVLSGNQTEERTYRFVPDCNPEWVFNVRSALGMRYKGETQARTLPAHSIGQFFGFLDITMPAAEYEFFAIKFHPWSAHLLWDGPMRDYTDNLVDLGTDGPRWAGELAEQLIEGSSTQERIRLAENCLRRRLSDLPDPRLSHCFQSLGKEGPNLRIKALETVTNLSQRRLEQLFSEKIGLPPKRVQRILRLRKAIEHLRDQPHRSLAEVAHQFHYFDQPHFIREFRHFTGFAPGDLRRHLNPDMLNFIVS